MLSVNNGLRNSAEERLVSLLILFDLSAAFDTLDHKIMLDRLSLTFGIRGTALPWLASWLLKRTQCVVLNDVTSSSLPLLYGLPQGSVLGKIPCILYTSHWPTLLTTTVSIIRSSQITPSSTMPPSQVTFVI